MKAKQSILQVVNAAFKPIISAILFCTILLSSLFAYGISLEKTKGLQAQQVVDSNHCSSIQNGFIKTIKIVQFTEEETSDENKRKKSTLCLFSELRLTHHFSQNLLTNKFELSNKLSKNTPPIYILFGALKLPF